MVVHKIKKNKTYIQPIAIDRRRIREQQKWAQLFQQCDETHNVTIVAKRHPEIKLKTLYDRYHKYKQQQQSTTTIKNDATIDHRGVYTQTFTPEQETQLANHIRNTIECQTQIFNTRVIREQATLFYNQLHQQQTRKHTFKASDGWIQRFKARHEFKSHKTKIVKKTKDEKKKNYIENDIISYKNDVHEAILDYGSNYVWNMDETPAPCIDYSSSGWNMIRQPLIVNTDGDEKKNVTIIPTVSASGISSTLDRTDTRQSQPNEIKINQSSRW
jgi:hypothetical protein